MKPTPPMKNRMHSYPIKCNTTCQIKEKFQLNSLQTKFFGTSQIKNSNRTLEMKANLNTWEKFHYKQKLRHAANERDIIYACAIAREGLRPSSKPKFARFFPWDYSQDGVLLCSRRNSCSGL